MPKLAAPLTDEQVNNAQTKDKPYKLSDGGNLYLLVNPNGAKYWRMDFRIFNTRRTVAFGAYPEVSLSAAREQRDNARNLIAEGIDPVELKREQGKRERAARPKAPLLHLSMNGLGEMVIENKSSRLILSAAQVEALRAFLTATNEDTPGE